MLERQGARIMLDEIKKDSVTSRGRTWITAPLEPPFGRGINFEIQTARVDELYDRVQKTGATIFLPLENKWYRIHKIEICNRQFIVLDPDGYLLRFAEYLDERPVRI